jgi:toxin ParE1/3/4
MKRYSVSYREEAADDLAEIYRWVYAASLSPVTAERFLQRILALCEKIGSMPHGGQPRDDLLPGLRTFPFEKRAVIAYRLNGETVEITNVFYGGRDYAALYQSEDDPDR